MAAWVKMVVGVTAMLVPGGLLFLLLLAVGRAWVARLREASPAGHHDLGLLWRAFSRVKLKDVFREARQMASFRMTPARL